VIDEDSYLVGKSTGEIKGEVVAGSKIISKNSLNYLKEQREFEKLPTQINNFFKGNVDEIKLILEELDVFEKAMLFTMASYVGYDDCCLKHNNGKDINSQQLIKMSKMSKNKGYDVIDMLHAKDILYIGKNSRNYQYFVNPWIFNKGVTMNKVLRRMFMNYHIRSLDNVQWKDLRK